MRARLWLLQDPRAGLGSRGVLSRREAAARRPGRRSRAPRRLVAVEVLLRPGGEVAERQSGAAADVPHYSILSVSARLGMRGCLGAGRPGPLSRCRVSY